MKGKHSEHDWTRKKRQKATCHPDEWNWARGLCKKCWCVENKVRLDASKRKYVGKNRDKVRESQRRSYLKHKDRVIARQREYKKGRPWLEKSFIYNATEEELKTKWEEQQETCPLCLRPLTLSQEAPKGSRPHVDHDHVTEMVRSLLCGACNTMLGMSNDTPEIHDRAAAYLRYWKEEHARLAKTAA